MKLKRTVAMAALVAAVGMTACDENGDVTGIVIADLEGTWDASTLTFSPTSSTSTANPVPFVALGGDLVVMIDAGGDFTGTLTVPAAVTGGEEAELPVAGSMSVDEVDGEDILTVDFSATTEAIFAGAGLPFADFDGPLTLTGSQLTVTNETTFDFDTAAGPNEAEAALLTLIMARTST